MEKVNLADAFGSFEEQWAPRLAGELNGQAVKLAKAEGEFVWHHHEDADELFFVVSGALRIELREESDIVLQEGEFVIVPEASNTGQSPTAKLRFSSSSRARRATPGTSTAKKRRPTSSESINPPAPRPPLKRWTSVVQNLASVRSGSKAIRKGRGLKGSSR